jgi:hypothetical protein
VNPQAELRAFAGDLWIVDGPPVRFAGVPIPTRAIVVRLSGGSLWVNSPVEVSPHVLEAIRTLGPVTDLVAPTMLHVWRLQNARGLFPGAQLWGPRKLPKRYSIPDLHPIGELPAAWSRDLDAMVFEGSAAIEEVEFLHKPSRTLIMADFIQNYADLKSGPLLRFLLKLAGVANGGTPLDLKLTFFDRRRARASLETLLSWDFDRLIVAHGVCLEAGAKPFVERAFSWLKA